MFSTCHDEIITALTSMSYCMTLAETSSLSFSYLRGPCSAFSELEKKKVFHKAPCSLFPLGELIHIRRPTPRTPRSVSPAPIFLLATDPHIQVSTEGLPGASDSAQPKLACCSSWLSLSWLTPPPSIESPRNQASPY